MKPRYVVVVLALASACVAPSLLQSQDQDLTPPALLNFTLSVRQVDTSASAAQIPFSLHLTDNLSGVASVAMVVYSPAGSSGNTVWAGATLVSGTALDGVYEGNISLPVFSQAGTWTISEIAVRDKVGNHAGYFTPQLEASGFPTTFMNGFDHVPPTTVAGYSPVANAYGWNSTDVTINLHATDNVDGSGIKGIQFAVG